MSRSRFTIVCLPLKEERQCYGAERDGIEDAHWVGVAGIAATIVAPKRMVLNALSKNVLRDRN